MYVGRTYVGPLLSSDEGLGFNVLFHRRDPGDAGRGDVREGGGMCRPQQVRRQTVVRPPPSEIKSRTRLTLSLVTRFLIKIVNII